MSVPSAPVTPLSRLERPRGASLVLLVVMLVTWLGFAAAIQLYGKGAAFFDSLVLRPDSLLAGQVWRLFTAPLLHAVQGSSDATHAIVNLACFYYFTLPIQKAWGSTRLVVMLACAALIGELVMCGLLLAFPSITPFVAGDSLFGSGAMVASVMVAWVYQRPNATWMFWGVVPVRGITLIGIALAIATLGIVLKWQIPEGALAPIVGIGVGYALGAGTPSPIRRAWLRGKLKKISSRPTSAPHLRVIEGEKGRSGSKPPPDKRWLN
jgi:membrane associated rhomboid family serine protease